MNKIGLASFHLDGDSQLWFLKIERDSQNLWGEEFKTRCNGRWLPSPGGIVEIAPRWNGRWLPTSLRTISHSSQFFDQWTRGSDIYQRAPVTNHHIVELQHPPDLIGATSLARLYERRIRIFNEAPKQPTANSLKPPFAKRLSRIEMEERRAKGHCFNSDEIYNRDHQCKQIFWLEGIEDVNCLEDNPGKCDVCSR